MVSSLLLFEKLLFLKIIFLKCECIGENAFPGLSENMKYIVEKFFKKTFQDMHMNVKVLYIYFFSRSSVVKFYEPLETFPQPKQVVLYVLKLRERELVNLYSSFTDLQALQYIF